MTIQTHKRTCSLCEATCGIEIELNPATEEILTIKGDKSVQPWLYLPEGDGLAGFAQRSRPLA